MRQTSLDAFSTSVELHKVNRRDKRSTNWETYHHVPINCWNICNNFVVTDDSDTNSMHYYDPYMEWYRRIMRRFFTPPTASRQAGYQPIVNNDDFLVEGIANIQNGIRDLIPQIDCEFMRLALQTLVFQCSFYLEAIGRENKTNNPNHAPDEEALSSRVQRQRGRG